MASPKHIKIEEKTFDYIRYCFLTWVVTISMGSLICVWLFTSGTWSLKESSVIGIIQVFLASFVFSTLLSIPAIFLFGFGLKLILLAPKNTIRFKALAMPLILFLVFLTQWVLTGLLFVTSSFNIGYAIAAIIAVLVTDPKPYPHSSSDNQDHL